MRLFRTCRTTGRKFKRTGSNYPIGSKQRYRIDFVRATLDLMVELSNLGSISSYAVAAMEFKKELSSNCK